MSIKYESLTEMLDSFGSVDKMLEYIDKRLDLMARRMEHQEYLDKVIIERSVFIDGFELREIDAFIEGVFYNNVDVYKECKYGKN